MDGWGNVELTMSHASQYAIVLDQKNHTLPFTDVGEEDWYNEAVEFVYRQGIMTGTSATIFAPNAPLSRAMVAQILYNLEGQPEVTETAEFTDVGEGHWTIDSITWANEAGLMIGYGNDLFYPARPGRSFQVSRWRQGPGLGKDCNELGHWPGTYQRLRGQYSAARRQHNPYPGSHDVDGFCSEFDEVTVSDIAKKDREKSRPFFFVCLRSSSFETQTSCLVFADLLAYKALI